MQKPLFLYTLFSPLNLTKLFIIIFLIFFNILLLNNLYAYFFLDKITFYIWHRQRITI